MDLFHKASAAVNPYKCSECGKGGPCDMFGMKDGQPIHIKCRDGITGPLAHEQAFKEGGDAFIAALLRGEPLEAAAAEALGIAAKAGIEAYIKEHMSDEQWAQLENAKNKNEKLQKIIDQIKEG